MLKKCSIIAAAVVALAMGAALCSKVFTPEVQSFDGSVVLAAEAEELFSDITTLSAITKENTTVSSNSSVPCGKGWKLYIDRDANGDTSYMNPASMWCERASENDKCSCAMMIIYRIATSIQ